MVNTPMQAIANANRQQTGYGGLCLAFVQDMYQAPHINPSAASEWANSRNRHPTNNMRDIPVGAPIHFSQAGNPYGHIAIYLGNGMMRTTYSPDNRIHTMNVTQWLSWGYRLEGYTTDIGNQPIPGLTPTQPTTQGAEDMPLTEQEVQHIAALTNSYKYGNDPNTVWNYLTGTFNVLQGVTKQIAQLQAALTAQNTAVQALCGSLGADPADIGRIVQDAVKAKLDSIDITVSSAPKQEG